MSNGMKAIADAIDNLKGALDEGTAALTHPARSRSLRYELACAAISGTAAHVGASPDDLAAKAVAIADATLARLGLHP
jgi:hypothetical protein